MKTVILFYLKLFIVLFLLIYITEVNAGDWTNSGCNAQRNGITNEYGPTGEDILWSGGRTSLIAWLPVTEGSRVFMVRQANWPGSINDSLIVAMDLISGGELWTYEIPYNPGDWTIWIAGVKNGQVYASRSGNGASVSAKLYALSVEDGSVIWISDDDIDAGPYDGVVFTSNGDPVIASFRDIWRINSLDGSTVWHNTRTGSVSGECGGAIYGNAFYVADTVSGGQSIIRYDLNSGAKMYQSPVMSGFLSQTTPFVGPDGTVYYNRAQGNPLTDFYYAFTDTGTEFIEKWHIPSITGGGGEFGIGTDGSVYLVIPGPELVRVDPVTGIVINSYLLPNYDKAHIAVDTSGNIYFSNGDFAGGYLYAFDAELHELWSVPVTNINIGGPSLGESGIMVVCGIGTDVRAYQSIYPTPTPTATPGMEVPVISTTSFAYLFFIIGILIWLFTINLKYKH
ncbi:MAG: hypothetical protein A2161_14435 [Candidatus Schekmanbacteria bacterium RBG_13_48_7]|uniref:Pyrrolo-quinoline quinone repeat domain-containing protein n=1 Tax=Candidatus Schekmanbacteria bacterium RBG_13_48_7 TaxID=1817878 RepID=A0A1F7S036_9BACT|nr:MAG: hypothetical protein A2161_14435 [Candidatus Schekmanbacteria bacterium RBG_13_48_7]